jgi:hypothetical protein
MTSELYNEVLNNTLNLNNKKTNQFESHKGQLLFLVISLATFKLTFIPNKMAYNDVKLNSCNGESLTLISHIIIFTILNLSKDIV